jgi:hypothetical protein
MASSRIDLWKTHQRFQGAVDAVKTYVKSQNMSVETYGKPKTTLATKRIQVSLDQSVPLMELQKLVAPFGGKFDDEELRDNHRVAWLYVERTHSSWKRALEWFLLVFGIASFVAGFSLILYADKRDAKRVFY